MSEELSILSLFLEGVLSFFSPCVLPLVPLYIGYLTSSIKIDENKKRIRLETLTLTIFFVLGICTVFFLAGLSISALKSFFTDHTLWFQLFGGFLLILFGLFALGIIEIPFLQKEHRFFFKQTGKMNFIQAYLMGFFFSFAWSPCIGPLLASAILQSATATTSSLSFIYLASYTCGFVFIFLLLGLFTEEILRILKKYNWIVKYTKIIGGLVVVGMGCYMLFNANQTITSLMNRSSNTAVTEEESETVDEEDLLDIEKYSFTLEDYEGNSISLEDYKGKTVVVNFFATWCTYCKLELPSLQTIHETDDDVVVLLVATPEYGSEGDKEYIHNFMEENGYTMTVLFDTDQSVFSMYGVTGLPTSYYVKPDGSFLGYMPGYVDEANLQAILEQCKE